MIFLRMVPPEVMQGVTSGLYKITGSVVREVSTGRGVAFLQETGLLQNVMNSVLTSGGNPVAALVNVGLGVVGVAQNQQIKSRLAEIQSSLALLQNMQLASLAVSGFGLGVSVVGFAVMLKRLKAIETHLGSLEAKIDSITTDRRSDGLRMIFADVATQLETVDTLSARSNKVHVAEAAEQALAISAGRLESLFQQKSDTMQTSAITPADMDMLWSLAAAIRLCHEAGLRALYTVDELEAAKQLAERRAERFYGPEPGPVARHAGAAVRAKCQKPGDLCRGAAPGAAAGRSVGAGPARQCGVDRIAIGTGAQSDRAQDFRARLSGRGGGREGSAFADAWHLKGVALPKGYDLRRGPGRSGANEWQGGGVQGGSYALCAVGRPEGSGVVRARRPDCYRE